MKQIIDSIVEVTETLIKMKTVSSSSNKEVIDYVEKELLQNSFEVEVQTYKAKNGLDKYNLVAKLGKENGGSPGIDNLFSFIFLGVLFFS